jgi:D-threo-aldose 1-dehydrogenase
MSIRNALPAGPLGFGTAPLGNMFRDIPEDEALATVEAAWEQGTRYFDTAPFYGAGLAEIRLGKVLAKHRRDEYVVSSKVGHLVLDEVETGESDFGEKSGLFAFGRKNKVVVDYTEAGTHQSIEGSLVRMDVGHLDFVWVHDLAADFLGDAWVDQFEIARKGAFRVLDSLRDQRVIKGWGLGVNKVEPIERLLGLDDLRPDGMLLAGRYTLLDHASALDKVMPTAAAKGVDIVVGGPYSSGILAGGTHFEYQDASPEIIARVDRIKALAAKHDTPIKAAAVQFVLAHPAVGAVIPGASKPSRIAEDHAATKTVVPDAFWRDLREQGLVDARAPLPIDR